jgi:preprotein translocase subunit SecE
VVLTTVFLVAVFLFGVDWVWSNLLQLIGVLRFGGGGSFGSQAG